MHLLIGVQKRHRCLAQLGGASGLVFFVIFSVLATWSTNARAWLETQVRSSNIRIEVQDGGKALVQHEMMLKVRGGPLRNLSIDGVDRDAEVVGSPTLVRARSGKAAGLPMQLVSQRVGQRLNLELTYRRGVRGGTYLVRFAYRTDLRRAIVKNDGELAELRWKSPAYSDGIDSLRVAFSMPESGRRPFAVGSDPKKGTDLVARDDGVFLSEWRRNDGRDLLTLTRPHAVKGEQIEWPIFVDPSALSSELSAEQVSVAVTPPSRVQTPRVAAPTKVPELGGHPWYWFLRWSLPLAALYAALVLMRMRALGTSPILPMNHWLRSLAIVLSLTLAGVLGGTGRHPALCAVCILVAFVLATQRERPAMSLPQGPGHWKSVDLGTVRLRRRDRSPWEGWFRAGRFPGSVLLVGLLALASIVALRALDSSAFYTVFFLVLSVLVFPLFLSIGMDQRDATERQLHFLSDLARALIARSPKGIVLRAIGRFGTQALCCEELRIHVSLSGALTGALGIEVGVENYTVGSTCISYPVIVARVRDGSPAHRALPPSDVAARGREPTERVSLFRPSLPTVETTRALLVELCELLSDEELRAGKTLPARPSASRVRADNLRRAS